MTAASPFALPLIVTMALAIPAGVLPAPCAADSLGDGRLFFSASERGPGTGDGGGGGPDEADEGGGDAGDGRVAVTRPDEAPGREPDREPGPSGRDAALDPVGTLLYQARLTVDGRVQAIVGGRLCRAELAASLADESPLHCASLPEGVRALSLAGADERLVVTFDDGRRQRLALGEGGRR